MPDLGEPLGGTGNYELLSQGAEAVRNKHCKQSSYLVLGTVTGQVLCREYGLGHLLAEMLS